MKILKLLMYVVIFLVIIALSIGGYFLYKLYEELAPAVDKIVNYNPNEVTQVFDKQGRLVANLYDTEFRFYAKYDEIPPRLIEALLAIEDTMFFEHEGINLDTIFRATLKNIKSMGYVEGGSTLTQQLVKNMLLTRDKKLSRKVKEILLAIRTEQILSKEQILERYLNYIFLGHGYFGVKAAALGYFDTPLDKLSLKQMAMIVALPKSPVLYDPTKNLTNSLKRANIILERMHDLGWINNIEYKNAKKEVPVIHNQTLTQNKAPYVVDEVLKELTPTYSDIKSGGYKIYLTIDLDYQELAQKALYKGYENIKHRILDSKNAIRKRQKKPELNNEELVEFDKSQSNLNGAMIVTGTNSGEILAMVGGVDYRHSNFNRVTQAKRQFGSAIKPFVYQIALDSGYSTATQIVDNARTFKDGEKAWNPRNYSHKFRGFIPLQYALEHSINLATINLTLLVGEKKVLNALGKYGFKDFQKDLSIVLGSLSLSPLEAARQYSLFSNYGSIVDPFLVTKIVSKDGKIKEFGTKYTSITTPSQSYLITSILQNVVSKGTGRRARVPNMQVAGKTGTTNDSKDAWFCGFTPSIQAIIWYGRDDNTSISRYAVGGTISAPVFADFIKGVEKIDPSLKKKFDMPQGIYKRVIDGDTYYYTNKSLIPNNINNFTDDEVLF